MWRIRRKAAPLRFAAHSDTGPVRKRNEDSYGIFAPADGQPGEHLFVVADGMGGHANGQEASRLALATVHEVFFEAAGSVPDRLEQALSAANERVWALAHADGRAEVMGTTCTALVLAARRVYVAHVGDSRAYRFGKTGSQQLTDDHTLVEDLRRNGVLTEAEAQADSRRHALTRAIGTGPTVVVDVRALGALRVGDRFLLCSDGLDPVPTDEIGAVLQRQTPEQACRTLVARAAEAGSTDNATAVVIYA